MAENNNQKQTNAELPKDKEVVTGISTKAKKGKEKQGGTTKKPKKPPLPVNNVGADCGRDSIKMVLFDQNGKFLEFQRTPSVFVQTETLGDDDGCFTLGIKGDDGKIRKEHWMVGKAADEHPKAIRFRDRADLKVENFHVGFFGGLIAFDNLPKIAQGEEGKKKLRLRTYTLSLVDKEILHKKLQTCRWIIYDGVKYTISLTKDPNGNREGYGSVLEVFRNPKYRNFRNMTNGDLGGGTFNVTDFLTNGNRPRKSTYKSHGGGGIIGLTSCFLDVIVGSDLCREPSFSDMLGILNDARWEDGEIRAQLRDGTNCSKELTQGIENWFNQESTSQAISKLCKFGQTNLLVLSGGGMELQVVREAVKSKLVDEGKVNPEHIVYPEKPGISNITGIQ